MFVNRPKRLLALAAMMAATFPLVAQPASALQCKNNSESVSGAKKWTNLGARANAPLEVAPTRQIEIRPGLVDVGSSEEQVLQLPSGSREVALHGNRAAMQALLTAIEPLNN